MYATAKAPKERGPVASTPQFLEGGGSYFHSAHGPEISRRRGLIEEPSRLVRGQRVEVSALATVGARSGHPRSPVALKVTGRCTRERAGYTPSQLKKPED